MYQGIQFEAPNGFGCLSNGIRYYFAGDREDEVDGGKVPTVLIVWFAKNLSSVAKEWRARCIVMTRESLEEGLTCTTPKLRVLKNQYKLPPWMEAVDRINFDVLELRRKDECSRESINGESIAPRHKSYRTQVEDRLSKIAAAVQIAPAILRSADPLKAISATARGDKKKHPHRLQLWFFAFVLHGRSEWALKQPTHLNGKWSRTDDKKCKLKFGRPHKLGSNYGWSSADMGERIERCYLKYQGLGVTMREIHRKSLRKDFGCVTVKDEYGNDKWFHPKGEAFPSYGEFRYVVVKRLTLIAVQKNLYGAARVRSQANYNDGNYTEQYANILEEVQVDAYYVQERPRSVHSDDPTDPLVCAEAVCTTTGAVVGVGFSFGSETGESYRSMLFCMAAPKDYIARLYGIPPEKLVWIMQGVPANLLSDRGPAGSRKLAERLQDAFPLKAIAPSYMGQAKAVVESTHPKDTKTEGAPTYKVSDLNVIQMVKREIFRAASKNHRKDISNRLSDEAISDFVAEDRVASPHHYWEYLLARLRTSARQITLEDAVRSFWTPIELPVDRDGVRLGYKHYSSESFRKSGFQRAVGQVENLTISAYMFTMVMRTIWVEVGGYLFELEATSRVRIDAEETLIPLLELRAVQEQLAILKARTRASSEAATNRVEADFKEVVGLEWSSGRRLKGRPKKASGTVAHETKVIKGQIVRSAV